MPSRGRAEGVAKDVSSVVQLYERAGDLGNSMAMNNLGNILLRGGKGVPGDVTRADQYFERSVNAGNVYATNNLGKLFESGAQGVPKSIVRAKMLRKRACGGGHAGAGRALDRLLMTTQSPLPIALRQVTGDARYFWMFVDCVLDAFLFSHSLVCVLVSFAFAVVYAFARFSLCRNF